MKPPAAPSRKVLVRDLFLFQSKLWADGLKDVILSPLSFAAAVFGVIFDRPALFYKVMRTGEAFDGWLNLYGAARGAEHRADGLFGEGAGRAHGWTGPAPALPTHATIPAAFAIGDGAASVGASTH